MSLTESPRELLINGALELGVSLQEAQVDALMVVLRELQEWNQKINLTAITDEREAVIKHFLDSLSCVKAYDFSKGGSVIDVGTGAGFPGIPLKVVFPEIDLTLLDSVGKRLGYLDHLIELLGLKNARTLHARAEDAARLPAHRERYTVVLARAVASLPTLSELCLPLTKLKGFFIAMKGPDIAAEVSASKSAFAQLGGIHRETISLELPYGGGGRSLVVVEKQKLTPVIFPRKAGIPSRQPLGGKFPRA